jgi:hypothetical protein
MKKTYLIFSAVLVVLILAFSFSKTYLHSLEDEAKGKQSKAAIRAELDSLERALESRIGETKPSAETKLANPEMADTKSVTPPVTSTSGEPAGDQPASEAVTTTATDRAKESASKDSDLARAAEDSASPPTQDELTIYRLYVQKRLSLPSVITAPNLQKGKERIMGDLANSYGITAEQVSKIVDKVYEYRRKGSDN